MSAEREWTCEEYEAALTEIREEASGYTVYVISVWPEGDEVLGWLTDDSCALCWSVRRIPTHGRLTPCGN